MDRWEVVDDRDGCFVGVGREIGVAADGETLIGAALELFPLQFSFILSKDRHSAAVNVRSQDVFIRIQSVAYVHQ